MVGVAGRSKACDNCRRRRVKCDLAAPECNRCVKARLKCGGYRGLRFIQYSGKATPDAVSTASHPRSSSGCYPASSDTPADGSNCIAPFELLGPLRIQGSVDDIFMSYTHVHVLRETDEIVVKPRTARTLAGKSFLALSTTVFGIDKMEKSVIQRGLRRYGAALEELNKALSNSKECRSFDVLEAIIVMALFELLVGSRQHGWMTHALGLEKLLQMWGPDALQELPCLMIFERARNSIILTALALQKRTILSDLRWKTVPWLRYPERKCPLHLLIDITADCPELYALRHEILSGQQKDGPSKRSSLLLLLDKSRKVIRDLEAWEERWGPIVFYKCHELPSPSVTPTRSSSGGMRKPIWRTILKYRSLYDSSVTTLFHGALILLLNFVQGLKTELQDEDAHDPTMDRMHASAILICRSVNYHLDNLQDIGCMNILFPMRMAHEALGKYDEEIGPWLTCHMKTISSGITGRWATARHILDLGSPPDPASKGDGLAI